MTTLGARSEFVPDGRTGTVAGVRARLAAAAGRGSARLARLAGRSGGVIGGRVASRLDPTLLQKMSIGRRIVLVSGTNGKSTTAAMLARTVRYLGPAWNSTGANMPDGALSALLDAPQAALAVLETDESYVPRMIELTDPAIVVLLNLTRDQLDRIAEPAMVAARIGNALKRNGSATVVGNCADPLVVGALSNARRQVWVRPPMSWQLDAAVCPTCHEAIAHSPQGWQCHRCGACQPQADWVLDTASGIVGPGGVRLSLDLRLPGRANQVNAMFAVAAADVLGVPPRETVRLVGSIGEVSGRYRRLPRPGGSVRLLLAKNPAGWREVLEMIGGAGSTVVISVNSRGPDGHDPSWLWDVPFEQLRGRTVVATGERAADLSVRLRYAEVPHVVQGDVVAAVRSAPPGDVDLAADYTSFIAARSCLAGAGAVGTR
jgi:lipid II isoglutaminyl synthase (glutamine-hydrolysing)